MYASKNQVTNEVTSQGVVFEALEGRQMMSVSHHHAKAAPKPVAPRPVPAPAPIVINNSALTITQNAGVLQVIGTTGNDQITISQSGNVFTINNGSWKTTVTGTFSKVVVKGNNGNDSITIDPTVTENATLYGGTGTDTLVGNNGNDTFYAGTGINIMKGGTGRDTFVTLGSRGDTITGGGNNDSFWMDNSNSEIITDLTSAETTAGHVHRISSFLGGASTTLGGQTFAEPKTTDASMRYQNFSTQPLFSNAGPAADDVRQGYIGDCYWVVSLSSVAKADADKIRQSVGDLGDGTYAVRLSRNGVTNFVRVDANLPTWSSGQLAYADLGAQNSTWVAIMEKAFTYVRANSNPASPAYSTIDNGGWMSESYDALGLSNTNLAAFSATDWASQVRSALASNKAITFGTVSNPTGAPLIGNHAYLVDHLGTDANGNTTVTLRNPWGVDGAGSDGKDDGYVTMTVQQAFANTVGAVIANA